MIGFLRRVSFWMALLGAMFGLYFVTQMFSVISAIQQSAAATIAIAYTVVPYIFYALIKDMDNKQKDTEEKLQAEIDRVLAGNEKLLKSDDKS